MTSSYVFLDRCSFQTQQFNMDPPGKAWNKKVQVERAVAPDGGYAWFILVSCFFVFGLTFGVVKSFGVFYVEIQQYFGTTAAGTSWITSIAVATIHVAGNHFVFYWNMSLLCKRVLLGNNKRNVVLQKNSCYGNYFLKSGKILNNRTKRRS